MITPLKMDPYDVLFAAYLAHTYHRHTKMLAFCLSRNSYLILRVTHSRTLRRTLTKSCTEDHYKNKSRTYEHSCVNQSTFRIVSIGGTALLVFTEHARSLLVSVLKRCATPPGNDCPRLTCTVCAALTHHLCVLAARCPA